MIGQPNTKAGGKKTRWGPVKAERRSSKIINDGRGSLEKANDKKNKEDLEDNYNKCKSGKNGKPTTSRMLKVVDKIRISL
jgi:hypothetical protein